MLKLSQFVFSSFPLLSRLAVATVCSRQSWLTIRHKMRITASCLGEHQPTCGEFAELVDEEVAVGRQRDLVRLELVALRLYDDVAQFLLLPEPVHRVQDAPGALQVLLRDVVGLGGARTARVVEAGRVLRAQHRLAGRPEFTTAHIHTTPTTTTAGTARTTVHHRRASS